MTWSFPCKKSACLVCVQQRQCDRQSVKQTSERSPTHSYTLATGGGSISTMRRSRVIIYYFSSFWNILHLTDRCSIWGHFTIQTQQKSKPSVSDCTATHTHTQEHTPMSTSMSCTKLYVPLSVSFLWYQRDLTLWPWFQPSRWQHRRRAYIMLLLVPVWRACPW